MAWTVVAQFGLLALSAGLSYLLRPKPKSARALTLAEFDHPRAREGDAVPLIYGTCRINSPIVIGIGDLISTPRGDPSAPSFYEYNLGMRLLLGRGNADVGSFTGGAQLLKVYEGDKECESLTLNPALGPETPPGSFCDMYLAVVGGEAPYTFGYLGFYKGLWEQTRIPDDAFAGENVSTLPSYRGQIVVRLFQWNINTATTMPPLSFVVYNPVYIPGYQQYGAIGNGDANPAAVLYDLLANEWGGVANAATQIDTASFAAAAAVLQDEQHGCSLVIQSQTAAKDAIESILRQIDGVLYEDPTTRRYVLRLIREDYDINDLPVFDTSNVVGSSEGAMPEPEMSTTLWGEAVNEVNVTFTNPVSGYHEGTARAQDMALISAQGGQRKSATSDYPFVTSLQLALTLAARDLNLLSRPLARLQIYVNREGYDLVPGDPFVFSWPEWNNYSQVFRVIDLDFGTLTDGRIQITAVQDRFAIGGSVFPPDDEIGPTPVTADPIQVRSIMEAPRWIQLKAYEQGALSNVDAQRGYFLAVPEGLDSRYIVRTGWTGALQDVDMPGRVFPGRFTVETQYAKTTSAYDTTTHLRIENVSGWDPSAIDPTEVDIAAEGDNVIGIVDADGNIELLAFETVTDLGGGVWRLNNVWRGILDTVPATHAVGAQGYVLPGAFLADGLGTRIYTHGDQIDAFTQGAAGSSIVPVEDSPQDTFTARSRTLLPYPGSDQKINASKTPAALTEGGVTIEWKDRDRTRGAITRPDAAAETSTVESGTTYDAVAVKGDAVAPGSETLLEAGITSSSTAQIELGAAGHGVLGVGARTKRVAVLPGGVVASLKNWQTPLLDITAHHWRNLLRNPRFATDLSYWEQVTGTAIRATSGGLGAGGAYITSDTNGGVGNPGVVEYQQDVVVSGYLPKNYTAILDVYLKNTGDAGDTATIELKSLNAAGSVLQTQTYGPTDPGTDWVKQTLTISDLHDDTHSLRVRLVMTATGEIDGTANIAITECILRCGQISSQLLSNPSFEAGLTSWTAGGSGMQILSTTKYELANYTRPQDGASSTLTQTVALPTGFENGEAVCEFARMNDAADDTGEVKIEALDSTPSVVASATTGAEAISPSNVWQRRRLVLSNLPATTVNLRVTFTGTRVTGTPNNSCIDDFDLRVHKHLDPDEETVLFEDLDFVEQPLPQTITDWKQHFPDVPAPDYAIYDGGTVGRLGIEPFLEAGTGCFTGGKAVATGPEGNTTTCYESAGRSQDVDADVHTAPVGDAFAAFLTSDPFTAVAFWRHGETPAAATACGVMGRVIGGRGWGLELSSGGVPVAKLFGASSTKTATGSAVTNDGALHGAGMIHDVTAGFLRVVDANGVTSTADTSMGEMRPTSPGKFRILSTGATSLDRLPGQVVRCYLWRQALTSAQVQSILAYTAKPFSALTSWTRTGTVACVTASDSEGVLVEKFGADRAALAKDPASGRVGLVAMPAITNMIDFPFSAESLGSTWANGGFLSPTTLTLAADVDPSGHQQAVKIEGGSSTGLEYGYPDAITFGATGTRHLAWFARADTPHNATIILESAAETTIDSLVFAVTTQWQLFTWAAAWDDFDGTEGFVIVSPSDDGTVRSIYLSPMMLLTSTDVAPWPGTIPIGTPGATAPLCTIAPSAQFNREGEIELELVNFDVAGVIANAHNNTNDNDRRRITWPSTGGDDIGSEHYDGSGSDDTTAFIANTTIDIAEPWKARLRWNRAGCVDGSSAFVMLRAEQAGGVEQVAGRASTFSATTTPLTRLALLHEDGATSAMAGLVFGARLSARERKA